MRCNPGDTITTSSKKETVRKRADTGRTHAIKYKRAEDALYASEERYRWLLDISSDAVLLHGDGAFILVNEAAVKLYGATGPEQLIGKRIVDFIRQQTDPSATPSDPNTIRTPQIRTTDAEGQSITSLSSQIIRLDGTVLDVEIIGKHCLYQSRPCVQLVIHNLAESRHLESRLRFLAQYDALTGLPNHRQFRDCLNGAIARATRNQQKVAVILLSLDHLKTVNATFGHQAGNFVLQQVAERLKQCLRKGVTLARLDGDEFALILEGLAEKQGAAVIAEHILKVLSWPLVFDGREILVTASIGIALLADAADGLERLMQNADQALRHARSGEPNTYQIYNAETDALNRRNALRRTEIEQRVAHLTPREHEVMELLIAGQTNKIIAYRLDASSRTIENHRAHIMAKMQADSLPDLVRMVLDLRD